MDELTDEVVMVSPNLIYDPIFKQGECGMITRLYDDMTTAQVSFTNGETAEYPTDYLWMLAPGDLIAERLRAGDIRLEDDEQADLFQIHVLDMNGLPGYRMRALQWATENPNIFDASVLTVKYWIDNFYDPDRGRPRFPGFQR